MRNLSFRQANHTPAGNPELTAVAAHEPRRRLPAEPSGTPSYASAPGSPYASAINA